MNGFDYNSESFSFFFFSFFFFLSLLFEALLDPLHNGTLHRQIGEEQLCLQRLIRDRGRQMQLEPSLKTKELKTHRFLFVGSFTWMALRSYVRPSLATTGSSIISCF